jgi:hypothetical protein
MAVLFAVLGLRFRRCHFFEYAVEYVAAFRRGAGILMQIAEPDVGAHVEAILPERASRSVILPAREMPAPH